MLIKILYALGKLILLMIAITLLFASLIIMFLWLYPIAMGYDFKLAWLLTLSIGLTLIIFFAEIINWRYLIDFKNEYY